MSQLKVWGEFDASLPYYNEVPFEYITSSKGLKEKLNSLPNIVGLDLETTGLEPRDAKVRLIQIGTPDLVYVIDAFKIDDLSDVIEYLKRDDIVTVVQNSKFERKFLFYHYGIILRNCYCTLLAESLLKMGRPFKYPMDLKSNVARHLKVKLPKEEQKSDFGRDELRKEQLSYAAKDAAVVIPLRQRQLEKLHFFGLVEAARIEFEADFALAYTELCGIKLDIEKWTDTYEKALAEKYKVEQEAKKHFPGGELTVFGPDINFNSPAQLMKAITEIGFNLNDTSENSLKENILAHPVFDLLLKYRKYNKQCSTYGASFIKKYVEKDSRVYAGFASFKTVTGRTSSSSPNMQQIPATKEYRECFVPEEGNVFIVADYSQIELRIAAHLTQDPVLLETYRTGGDAHTTTAAAMAGDHILSLSKEDEEYVDARKKAKAVNFGLIYGQGVAGFQRYAKYEYGLDLTYWEAKKFIDTYRDTYKHIYRWQERCREYLSGIPEYIDGSKADAWCRTLSGRIRRISRYSENKHGQGLADFPLTEYLNVPVQGTAAEGMKLAMGRFMRAIEPWLNTVKIVCTVHDELVVEAPKEMGEQILVILKKCMEEGMAEIITTVPILAEPKICSSWGEK